ncbi:hypothetical protein HEP83_48850 [Streptomyces sp. RLA2-12]|nr:hypothetical protein [Streptomyces sp. RLA2-12]
MRSAEGGALRLGPHLDEPLQQRKPLRPSGLRQLGLLPPLFCPFRRPLRRELNEEGQHATERNAAQRYE